MRIPITDLELHPGEEIPGLPPPTLLLQDRAHLPKAQLRHKRRHYFPHIIRPFTAHSEAPNSLDRRNDMTSVEMRAEIIIQELYHLLRIMADPAGGFGRGCPGYGGGG